MILYMASEYTDTNINTTNDNITNVHDSLPGFWTQSPGQAFSPPRATHNKLKRVHIISNPIILCFITFLQENCQVQYKISLENKSKDCDSGKYVFFCKKASV